MNRHALASIISVASAATGQTAFANSMTCSVGGGTNNGIVYTTVATSAGINVTHASLAVQSYYVDTTEPAASDPWTPTPPPPNPYTLVVSGDWCIDVNTGNFLGRIDYGDYKLQTNVITRGDGRITFTGAFQQLSGTGTWGTNGGGFPTLSYSYLNPTVNGGGASLSLWNSASCVNGGGAAPPKVCSTFVSTSRNWEGLAFVFTFDNVYYTFTGQLTGTDTTGIGLLRQTITQVWNLAGTDPPAPVPLPTPAWLLGSALLGLGAAARQRRAKNGITLHNQ